jgi:hypothetical protein
MFCSNDTDLNNYFKRQEATEARYEHARAKALADMDGAEIDGWEVLWACEQFDKGLMTAEQVGKYMIEQRNATLEKKIDELL